MTHPRAGCVNCRRPIEFVPVIGWLHVLMSSASMVHSCENAWPQSYSNSALGVGFCPCGHLWHVHDVDEYRGDGSETCCHPGCQQHGCPGRVPAPAP
jgi:hypothetical protein